MIEPHSLENAHYFHKSFNTKIKYSAFVKTEVSVFLRWNNFQQGTRKKCTGMYYIYIYILQDINGRLCIIILLILHLFNACFFILFSFTIDDRFKKNDLKSCIFYHLRNS